MSKTTWDGYKWVEIPKGMVVEVAYHKNWFGLINREQTKLVPINRRKQKQIELAKIQAAKDAKNAQRRSRYWMKKHFEKTSDVDIWGDSNRANVIANLPAVPSDEELIARLKRREDMYAKVYNMGIKKLPVIQAANTKCTNRRKKKAMA